MAIRGSTKKNEDGFGKAIHRIEKVGKVLKEDVKKIGKGYGVGIKEEAKDLHKIMESGELVFYKTEAFAIVLRKLGGLYQFLDVCENLTREGYTMVNSEDVKNLPLTFGAIPMGSFYYFQHKKYIY